MSNDDGQDRTSPTGSGTTQPGTASAAPLDTSITPTDDAVATPSGGAGGGGTNTGGTGNGDTGRQGSRRPGLAGFLKWGSVAGAAALAAVLLIGFVTGMPQGTLRFGIVSAAASGNGEAGDRDDLSDILHGAYAKIDDAKRLYADLSFEKDFPLDPAFHPPMARFSGPANEGFIEEFTIEQEAGGVSVKARGLALFAWLYELMGRKDYYLAATRFSKEECAEGPCWRLTVNYTFGEGEDEDFIGPTHQIESDLAAFIVAVSVRSARTDWLSKHLDSDEPPPFLNIPPRAPRLEAWEAAADGLAYLQHGHAASFCANAVGNCRSRAFARLQYAIELSPQLTPAALGLAVIGLHEAFETADKGRPPYDVEHAFARASDWAARALQDSFIRNAVNASRFAPAPGSVNLREVALDSDIAIKARTFGCALAEHRRGRWKECLEGAEKLAGIPPLAAYIKMMQFDSRLWSGRGDNTADNTAVLAELEQEIASAESGGDIATAHQLTKVKLMHGCPSSDEAMAFFDRSAPFLETLSMQALLAAHIMECVTGEDRTDLEALVDHALGSDAANTQREVVALARAVVAAREDDEATALRYLKEARNLPWAMDAIVNRGGETGRRAMRSMVLEGLRPVTRDRTHWIETCEWEGWEG